MMWQSSLPAVLKTATCPDLVTEIKWWRAAAALIASTAMRMLPSVPFLNPTGHDRPEASWRCDCDSVVRAPIAHDLHRREKLVPLLDPDVVGPIVRHGR